MDFKTDSYQREFKKNFKRVFCKALFFSCDVISEHLTPIACQVAVCLF